MNILNKTFFGWWEVRRERKTWLFTIFVSYFFFLLLMTGFLFLSEELTCFRKEKHEVKIKKLLYFWKSAWFWFILFLMLLNKKSLIEVLLVVREEENTRKNKRCRHLHFYSFPSRQNQTSKRCKTIKLPSQNHYIIITDFLSSIYL